jgi:K+-transporting ATPase ATPase C chain
VLGLIYPAVMVLFGQLVFPSQANGSLITVGGKTVGSKLAAQSFDGPRYFHPRPSAVGYNAAGTSFSNLGPNSKALAALVNTRIQKILALEGPYNPGLTAKDIPVDAVTASGSGIDPDISQAYAVLQAPRIAAVRHLSLATVTQLIDAHVDGRSLGFLGEPGVNVLELNLALDQEH